MRGVQFSFSRKQSIAAVLLVATGLAAWRWRHTVVFQPDYWLQLVKGHPWGAPLWFVPVYALAVTFLVPTLPLNLVAGALWGPVLGTVVSLFGAFSGAMLGFVLARGTFGKPFARRVDKKFLSWLQHEFTRHGWKIVAFVRLNPVFPGPVSFLFGFTSIPFRTYCWASLVFLLPPTIAFSIIGDSIGAVVLRGYVNNMRNLLLLVGLSMLFLVGSAVILHNRYRLHRDPTSTDATP
jgi:uncharacterized membrane protein YdjX (TVP38/TMEM64 family)